MTRRALLVCMLLWLVATPVAAPVSAHEGTPGLDNVLDAVTPAVPGVTVQVVSTVADQLIVANPTPTPLIVLGPAGEPFLEIGPRGVLANLSSPVWSGSGGAARWSLVSTGTSWGWFDPRLPTAVPPAGARPGVPLNLAAWSIPMRYGARAVTVTGHLQYQPPTGSVVAKVVTPPPTASGLQVAVLPGGNAPAVYADWSGPAPVTVLGQQGEPFVRFGPQGAEANLASPTWAFSARVQGQPPTGGVDASAPPRWKVVSSAPRLSWLDPRAVYGPGTPPPDIQSRSVPTDLLRWSVPVEFSGHRADVVGVTQWVPDASSSSVSRQIGALQTHRTTRWSAGFVIGVAVASAAVAVVALARRLRHPRV